MQRNLFNCNGKCKQKLYLKLNTDFFYIITLLILSNIRKQIIFVNLYSKGYVRYLCTLCINFYYCYLILCSVVNNIIYLYCFFVSCVMI